MIITDVKPIKLQFWPKNPPRDGLAAIPTRDVFLVQIETDEGISVRDSPWVRWNRWPC